MSELGFRKPGQHSRALHLNRHKSTKGTEARFRVSHDQDSTSTAEKPKQVDRRGIVHRISITSANRTQNRLAVQEFGLTRDALAPGQPSISPPPPPRSASTLDAKGAAIAAPNRILQRCPERRVIRKTDDDVPGTPKHAQNFVERLSNIRKVLYDLEGDDGVDRTFAERKLERVAGHDV